MAELTFTQQFYADTLDQLVRCMQPNNSGKGACSMLMAAGVPWAGMALCHTAECSHAQLCRLQSTLQAHVCHPGLLHGACMHSSRPISWHRLHSV